MSTGGERWRRDRLAPALYDFGVKHKPLARTAGRLLWGADIRRFYAEIDRLGALPSGSAVLDLPCGGGVAFRGIARGAGLRYVGADVSPTMLRRARAEAERCGLSEVELVEADAEALPFEPGEFDLCLSFNGLHCFSNPERALAEIRRVLRPGGQLRATVAVRGAGLRQDAFIALYERVGIFGKGVEEDELRSWFSSAGFVEVTVKTTGALAFCSARRP